MIWPSCRPRGWLDVADGSDDLPEERAAHGDLSQLESDLMRMAYNTRLDFDQAALDACERPIRGLFWEVYALREYTEVIRQCVKLKPDLIVTEPLTGQMGPSDGIILAFLDMLHDFAVPLSTSAILLVERLAKMSDDLLFPGRATKKGVSDTALAKALNALKESGCPHGFPTSWIQNTEAVTYDVS